MKTVRLRQNVVLGGQKNYCCKQKEKPEWLAEWLEGKSCDRVYGWGAYGWEIRGLHEIFLEVSFRFILFGL